MVAPLLLHFGNVSKSGYGKELLFLGRPWKERAGHFSFVVEHPTMQQVFLGINRQRRSDEGIIKQKGVCITTCP